MSVSNYTPVDHLIKKKRSSPLISGPSKEALPITSPMERFDIHEVVEHEPQDEEIKPYVKVKKETVKIPEDLKKEGIVVAPPTQFPSYDSVKLPLTDEKVIAGLHKPATSSVRWLAELCMYLLRKGHLTLITTHGRLVRVLKKR